MWFSPPWWGTAAENRTTGANWHKSATKLVRSIGGKMFRNLETDRKVETLADSKFLIQSHPVKTFRGDQQPVDFDPVPVDAEYPARLPTRGKR